VWRQWEKKFSLAMTRLRQDLAVGELHLLTIDHLLALVSRRQLESAL